MMTLEKQSTFSTGAICTVNIVYKLYVVRNGEYYRCRDCKRNFSYSPIEDIDPEEIQRLLDRGIHRYAIA